MLLYKHFTWTTDTYHVGIVVTLRTKGARGPTMRGSHMVQFFLERDRIADFVSHLMNRKLVFAPHAKGQKSFTYIWLNFK